MNRYQRLVTSLALLGIAGMALYPPWYVHEPRGHRNGLWVQREPIGYAPIHRPPRLVGKSEWARPFVNLSLLISQLLAVGGIGGAIAILLGRWRRSE